MSKAKCPLCVNTFFFNKENLAAHLSKYHRVEEKETAYNLASWRVIVEAQAQRPNHAQNSN